MKDGFKDEKNQLEGSEEEGKALGDTGADREESGPEGEEVPEASDPGEEPERTEEPDTKEGTYGDMAEGEGAVFEGDTYREEPEAQQGAAEGDYTYQKENEEEKNSQAEDQGNEHQSVGENDGGDSEKQQEEGNTPEKSEKQKKGKKNKKNKKENPLGSIAMNLRIGNKIALGFLLVILIFGFVAYQAWSAYSDLEDAIMDSNAAAQAYNDVAQMDAELWRQYGYIYEYAILQREATLSNYDDAAERFDELFERVSAQVQDPDIIQELERIEILKDSMESVLYENIVPSMGTDGEQFLERRLRNVESRIRNIDEAFVVVSDHMQQETQGIIQQAEGQVASEQRELLLFLTIALAIAVVVTVVLSRGIAKPLKELQQEAERVSNGDLTLAFNGSRAKDEVGDLSRSFAQMSGNLKTLITSVKEASGKATQSSEILMETAKQSSGASEDLSKTIQEIAETADNQAQNTTEGTEKVNEMARTIENVWSSTESLKKSTENADQLRSRGLTVVEDLSEKTDTINRVTTEVSNIIQETDANTEKINKASIVIHSISEQTGLLALNAAIESARAGEAGRGFAVVADEIRKLAEQASHSTKEIEDIVKVLKEKSEVAVKDMKNLEGTITDQGQAVSATKGIFDDLSNAIDNTKEETGGVESYVQAMLDKKEEIVDVINQLASIAEENAASTEEASAATEEQTASMEEIQSASEQLTNLSYDLMEVVERFKV